MVSLISDADIYVKNLLYLKIVRPQAAITMKSSTQKVLLRIYMCELTKVTTEKTSLTQAVKKEKLNFNKFAPSKG